MSSVKGGKGKQLHLGSFLTALQAARAYDRAAILLRGPGAALNFSIEEYAEDPVLQVRWCVLTCYFSNNDKSQDGGCMTGQPYCCGAQGRR